MELKKNDETVGQTAWRKWLFYQQSEDTLFGEARFAIIACVHEASGYAVWYRRRLDNGSADLDGNFLLKFFSHAAKHDAIEFAVQVAGLTEDASLAITRLDQLAESALRMADQENIGDPFEQIK